MLNDTGTVGYIGDKSLIQFNLFSFRHQIEKKNWFNRTDEYKWLTAELDGLQYADQVLYSIYSFRLVDVLVFKVVDA